MSEVVLSSHLTELMESMTEEKLMYVIKLMWTLLRSVRSLQCP